MPPISRRTKPVCLAYPENWNELNEEEKLASASQMAEAMPEALPTDEERLALWGGSSEAPTEVEVPHRRPLSPMPTNGLTVDTLRQMFRYLQEWHTARQWSPPDDLFHGLDELPGGDGEGWSMYDVDHYFEASQYYLPGQQRLAIRLRLYEDRSRAGAAAAMGISGDNPVDGYVTDGLSTLVELINAGALPTQPRFAAEKAEHAVVRRGRLAELRRAAKRASLSGSS